MREVQLGRLTEDDLLVAAISIVKAAQEDGAEFVPNVVAVFEALRQQHEAERRNR
jgi:hypothetical protein